MTSRLTPNRIDPEAERRGVEGPDLGGQAVFVGVVRRDPVGETRVRALRYEAYAPLARRELDRLEKEAQARWGPLRVRIVHRVGRVPVGEASVVVAVGAPHRAQAFDACRYLIDRLKDEVPIWKSEETGPAARSGSRR